MKSLRFSRTLLRLAIASSLVFTADAEATRDPADFAKRFKAMAPDEQSEAAIYIGDKWAQSDADAALAWATTLENPETLRHALGGIIAGSAMENPRPLISVVLRQSNDERRSLLSDLFRKLADVNISKAVDEALELKDPKLVIASLDDVFQSWDGIEPLPLHKLAKSDKIDQEARVALIRRLGQVFAYHGKEYDKNFATDAIQNREFLGGYLTAISSRRPVFALDLLEQIPVGERKIGETYTISLAAVLFAPERALGLAMDCPNEKDRNQIVGECFKNLATQWPEKAAAWLAENPNAPIREELITSLAKQWLQFDPTACVGWAEKLSGNDRVDALAMVASRLAARDPKSAASQLSELLKAETSDRTSLVNASQQIGMHWTDAADSCAWVATLPPGKAFKIASFSLIERWCGSAEEPKSVGAWIETLPPGAVRDQLSETYVFYMVQYDAEEACRWGLRLKPTKNLRQILRTAASIWGQQNPNAAKDAILSSSLSDEQKQKLLPKN